MRSYLTKILLMSAMMLTVSCSEYHKLVKSGTSRQKYDKALEYYNIGKYQRSLALLKDVSHLYAQTEQADTVAFYTGLCFYKTGDFGSSCEQFDGFRRSFGRSPFLEEAEYYFAKGFYYMSPKPENDQGYTFRAMRAIGEYLDRYPKSRKQEELLENMIEMRQKLYEKSYQNARIYYDIGYYNSAVTALKNAIIEYPESNRREELSYLIVSSQCKFARNSIASLQRQRYLDTQNAYFSFIDEYPDSQFRDAADVLQKEAKAFLDKYKEDHPNADEDAMKEKDNSDKVIATPVSTMDQANQADHEKKKKRAAKVEKAQTKERNEKADQSDKVLKAAQQEEKQVAKQAKEAAQKEAKAAKQNKDTTVTK